MTEKVEAVMHFRKLTPFILSSFTRDQLRMIARKHKIPRGRNKKDTIDNLVTHARLGIGTIVEINEVKVSINI